MITSFDDYMIHQTAEAVSMPAQSDRNFYERHWMSGFDNTGNVMFEMGFGLYPNRRVMDGHLSVVIGNKQYAFHASPTVIALGAVIETLPFTSLSRIKLIPVSFCI